MKRLCAIVLLALTAKPALAPSVPQSPTVELTALLNRVRGGTTVDRVAAFGEHFLGVEYEDGPLGEGESGKYDTNPLFRTDRFDCTTFVETVLALAWSKDFPEFKSTLARIRYRRGKVSFVERNHFPDADWIPNNSAAGFVTDITEQIAGPQGVLHAVAKIDKRGWYEHLGPKTVRVPALTPRQAEERLAQLRAEGTHFYPQTVSLPYIPLENLVSRKEPSAIEQARRKKEEDAFLEARRVQALKLPEAERPQFQSDTHNELVSKRLEYLVTETEIHPEILDRIPSGTILNIVRPNMSIPGTHMNISHQGFVVRKNGQAFFRHVSRSGGERVKNVPLANYIRLCLLSPPIKGIHLLKVNERRGS